MIHIKLLKKNEKITIHYNVLKENIRLIRQINLKICKESGNLS